MYIYICPSRKSIFRYGSTISPLYFYFYEFVYAVHLPTKSASKMKNAERRCAMVILYSTRGEARLSFCMSRRLVFSDIPKINHISAPVSPLATYRELLHSELLKDRAWPHRVRLTISLTRDKNSHTEWTPFIPWINQKHSLL